MNLRDYCPRYSKYQTLYSQSTRLQAALCTYYATVVTFCGNVVEVMRRSDQGAILELANSVVGFLLATKSFLKPFEAEFGEIRIQLEKRNLEVEKEVDLAEREAAVRERQLQEIERKSAQGSRHLSSLFHKTVRSEKHEAHEWRKQITKHKSKKKRQAMIDKLSSYDFKRAYKQACRRRHGTTGSWVQRRSEFEKWLRSAESSVFWCSGIPGSGKTVLAAGIIGELCLRIPAKTSDVRFFFCEYDRAESLKAVTILGSLIRQCLDVDNMSEKIEKSLETATQDSLDSEELGNLLVDVLEKSPQQCIVVDTIDECDKKERRIPLTTLRTVLKFPAAGLKLFLTSGPYIDVELNRLIDVNYHVSMTSAEVDSDIRAYIESALKENLASGELAVGETLLVEDIREALVKGAKGMFLWVAFQIQDICAQKSDEDIRCMINDLPNGLSETYERVLYKINNEKGSSKWAQKIFRWVAAAKQPLTLEELREAIAIRPGQPSRNPATLINDINQLVPCCRNLVILDEEEKVVQFVHHTVKRFLLEDSRDILLGNFHFQLQQADREIGESCVTYLNFTDLKRQVAKRPTTNFPSIDLLKMLKVSLSGALGVPRTSRWLGWLQWAKTSGREADLTRLLFPSIGLDGTLPIERLNSAHTLLPYASKHWLLHSSQFTEANSSIWKLRGNIFNDESSFGQFPWTRSEWLSFDDKVLTWIVEHEHLALLGKILGPNSYSVPPHNDLKRISQKLLDKSVEAGAYNFVHHLVNLEQVQVHYLCLALQSAVGFEHGTIIDLLLTKLSAPNSHVLPEVAHPSLAIAAGKGNFEIVKRLLEAGIPPDIDVTDENGENETPLSLAIRAGCCDIVDLLLDAGFDTTDLGASEHLRLAFSLNHLEIYDKLVFNNMGDKLHSLDSDMYFDVIQFAAKRGHLEVIDRFLERATNIDDSFVLGLMEAASDGARVSVLDRLLKEKVHSRMVRPNNYVLSKAIQGGDIRIVDMLLKAGADVENHISRFPWSSALEVAIQENRLDIFRRLLEAGVDLSTPHGDNALQLAATSGTSKSLTVF